MCAWPCIIDINKVDDQLDATITICNLQISSTCSGNSLPILRSARLWFTPCGIMFSDCVCSVWRMLLEQHPSHWTHSPCHRTPGFRPTTIWGHYTTCCKSQSCTPEDGQRIARNMLSQFKINKLLSLHLVGHILYSFIGVIILRPWSSAWRWYQIVTDVADTDR